MKHAGFESIDRLFKISVKVTINILWGNVFKPGPLRNTAKHIADVLLLENVAD